MINKAILQGRLTAIPELRTTQTGISVCEFTVAWSERYKETEKKCFLRCRAWRSTAEFLEKYFTKGQEIVVIGKIMTEEWEKDNEKKSRTVCEVEEISFCGKKEVATTNNEVATTDTAKIEPSTGFELPNIPDDDLPF